MTLPDRQLLEALISHTPADRLGVELRIWDWNSPIRDVLGDEADDVVATVLPSCAIFKICGSSTAISTRSALAAF